MSIRCKLGMHSYQIIAEVSIREPRMVNNAWMHVPKDYYMLECRRCGNLKEVEKDED